MRVLRSVTLQPIAWPSRTLKVAIDLRALVITAFWPAISAEIGRRGLDLLAVVDAFADAHVDDDLLRSPAPACAFL